MGLGRTPRHAWTDPRSSSSDLPSRPDSIPPTEAAWPSFTDAFLRPAPTDHSDGGSGRRYAAGLPRRRQENFSGSRPSASTSRTATSMSGITNMRYKLSRVGGHHFIAVTDPRIIARSGVGLPVGGRKKRRCAGSSGTSQKAPRGVSTSASSRQPLRSSSAEHERLSRPRELPADRGARARGGRGELKARGVHDATPLASENQPVALKA